MNFGWIEEKLRNRDASAADSLDLLLSAAGEELGLDDDRLLGQRTLAEDLVHALQRSQKRNKERRKKKRNKTAQKKKERARKQEKGKNK